MWPEPCGVPAFFVVDDRKRKLEQLMRTTGSTVGDMIKQAIDALYERVQRGEGKSKDRLMDSGFVGCADGPRDLSVSYKDRWETSIRSGHGHR